MIRLLFLGIGSLFFMPSGNEDKERFTAIEKEFPLVWKTKMGCASFRTNHVLSGSNLFIGSNGENFKDYTLSDKRSGVYKINRRTGAIEKQFGGDILGDMDVNGLLFYKNKIYFGNDNDEMFCTDLNGKTIWHKQVSGDIEHEPVLIQAGKSPLVVYATERGEVTAVDPETGKTAWSYYTPNFNGWKTDDNRTAFKVESFFLNSELFFTKPMTTDMNQDGIQDLLYMTYSRDLYAIDGKNGKLLWHKQRKSDDYIRIIQELPYPKDQWKFLLFRWNYTENYKSNYSLYKMNTQGKEELIANLGTHVDDLGLNCFFPNKNEIVINSQDHLIKITNMEKIDSSSRAIYAYRDEYKNTYTRNYSDMLFASKSFKHKKYGHCLINLVQQDYLSKNEKGFIEIISLDQNKVVERLEIPAYSEMAPIVEDVNQDGFLDLLINGYDGFLYCYNLRVPVEAIDR